MASESKQCSIKHLSDKNAHFTEGLNLCTTAEEKFKVFKFFCNFLSFQDLVVTCILLSGLVKGAFIIFCNFWIGLFLMHYIDWAGINIISQLSVDGLD